MAGRVAAAIEASQEVLKLQRLKTAVEFISSSYLPPALSPYSSDNISKVGKTSISLRCTATLRSSRSCDRKRRWLGRRPTSRGSGPGTETTTSGRRRSGEKRRRRSGRRRARAEAWRDLKKVNVKGMKKMSDFFKKA